MSLKEHSERLERRLDNLRKGEKTLADRSTHVASFVGGVAASAAYRAYLHKNNKTMPTVLGLDADAALGGAALVCGFFQIVPERYADLAVNAGAGLIAGTLASKVQGMVDPSMATKGEIVGSSPRQMGMGSHDVSADRGAALMSALRARRAAALPNKTSNCKSSL